MLLLFITPMTCIYQFAGKKKYELKFLSYYTDYNGVYFRLVLVWNGVLIVTAWEVLGVMDSCWHILFVLIVSAPTPRVRHVHGILTTSNLLRGLWDFTYDKIRSGIEFIEFSTC